MNLPYYTVAQPTQTPWKIKGNGGSSFFLVDWSGFPSDLDTNFFIISLNQTTLSPYKNDDDHHDDNDKKLVRFLQIVNSSQASINITNLPIAAEFTAIVYLVDKNNEIYKSEKIINSTEEGGKFSLPLLLDISAFFKLVLLVI